MDVPPAELTPDEQKRGLTLQDREVRNRVTKTLFERARKLSPAPFFVPESAGLITLGNVEDDLAAVKDADWIIEAVLERMDLKRDIHAKIASHARPDAIVTTNTSGLSINGMTESLPRDYRRRFFGTHFFNPPRYLRLLEIIPTTDTDPGLLDAFSDFGEGVLGKGVASVVSLCSRRCGSRWRRNSGSTRWTPSPARPSAGPKARPSGSATWSAWT
jgi:3-hydroxyacyl-CoA dehydrogenase